MNKREDIRVENDIKLTDEEIKTMKEGITEILEFYNKNVTESENKDQKFISFEDIYSVVYGDSNDSSNSVDYSPIDEVSESNDENNKEIIELLKIHGLLEGLEIIKKKPELLQSRNSLTRCIDNLDKFVNNQLHTNSISTQMKEELKNNHSSIMSMLDKENFSLERTIEKIKKNIEIFKNNPDLLNVDIPVMTFLSASLTYRTILEVYSRTAYPKQSTLTNLERRMRAREVRFFSLLCAPLITFSLISIGSSINPKINLYSMFNNISNNDDKKELIPFFLKFVSLKNEDNNNSDKKNKSPFFKWFKFFLLILSLVLILLIISNKIWLITILKLFSVMFFLINENRFLIKCLLIVMVYLYIFWYLFILFKFLFFFETEIKISQFWKKVLPKFIMNWIEDLNESSKMITNKEIFRETYFRITTIYIVIGIIYTYLFIFVI